MIVIIGENHTFDNIFATYQPPAGQHVMNLLSEGIVTKSGGPGPHVSQAEQQTASDTSTYQITPTLDGPYTTLPQPNTTYVDPACDGQVGDVADTRFPDNLANAPYQITKYVPYFDGHQEYASQGTCEYNGAVCRRPDPPLLPDVPGDLERDARSVDLGTRHVGRLERSAAPKSVHGSVDGPGRA